MKKKLMTKLEKIITDDGTISFYNKDIGDIYHSRIGAQTEALEKFIKPCRILENLHNYTDINVFDVCFGPGYNSKVLISSILQMDPEKKIHLTAVEIDPLILLKSTEINFTGYQSNLKVFFDEFLHKVYYSTISDQYIEGEVFETSFHNITFKLFVDDARKIVTCLNDSFDLIFLDPFSPYKLPELWTIHFFKYFYNLLKENGKLLTYSSAYSVLGGLSEAGFYIGNTIPVGRKSPGTIATKNKSLIDFPLSDHQIQMIKSTAGIPFEDPELNWNKDEILSHRAQVQKNSHRTPSSRLRNKSDSDKNNS